MKPAEIILTAAGPVILLALAAAWVGWPFWLARRAARNRRRAPRERDRPRRRPRLPLPLLRAWTWRRRRRGKHCAFLADLACGLTEDEQRAWARLERNLR